jgi:hypothetical protein
MTAWTRTWRLMLAKVCYDTHARELIEAEIGDSSAEWREVATAAVNIAVSGLIRDAIPRMDTSRNISGPVVNYIEDALASFLDVAAQYPEHQPRRASVIGATLDILKAARAGDVSAGTAIGLHTNDLSREQIITALRLLFPLLAEYFETQRATAALLDGLDEG